MNKIERLKQRMEKADVAYMAYYQAKATVLLAEQVKRIADLLESEAERQDQLADSLGKNQ